MHDVLLTTLARIGALKKVTARTSELPYRDPAQRNLQPIATQLGVAHVVEGSVSRARSKVRILVKVTDAATGLQRSAEPSIGDLSDGFKMQADLSAQIAQWLSATISPDQKLALAQKLPSNPAAYDLDLRARRWRGLGNSGLKTTREGEELIIRPLEQAVALDPAFAAAYVELSQVHLQLWWWDKLGFLAVSDGSAIWPAVATGLRACGVRRHARQNGRQGRLPLHRPEELNVLPRGIAGNQSISVAGFTHSKQRGA